MNNKGTIIYFIKTRSCAYLMILNIEFYITSCMFAYDSLRNMGYIFLFFHFDYK